MSAHERDEPTTLSGLNALLSTAAENSPDHILLEDDGGAYTAAAVARRTRQLAAMMRLSGLSHGERVLVVAGAEAASLVAIAAALRGGLEPVLASCHIGPVDLAALAQVSRAAAVIGPSRYGDQHLGETYLTVAAVCPDIRGLMSHGPDLVDGAADVSSAALDAMTDASEDSAIAEMPTIATFAGPRAMPYLVSHRQAALFTDAFSLVEQAGINPSRRLISLLAPSSLAGLVAGPYAALAGASRLVFHGPFSGRRFLRHLDAEPGAHLVAPAALGGRFGDEQAWPGISSLTLVSRLDGADAFVAPPPLAGDRPVVDLYAFGEDAVRAQRRRDGIAEAPLRPVGLSVTDGLGARLNRARAEHRLHNMDGVQ